MIHRTAIRFVSVTAGLVAIVTAGSIAGCGGSKETPASQAAAPPASQAVAAPPASQAGAPAADASAQPPPPAVVSPEYSMPDVIGKDLAEAQRLLPNDRFKLEIQEQVSLNAPSGRVLSQNPVAGSAMPVGAAAHVTIAVPDRPFKARMTFNAGRLPTGYTHVALSTPAVRAFFYDSRTGAATFGQLDSKDDQTAVFTTVRTYPAGLLSPGFTTVIDLSASVDRTVMLYNGSTGSVVLLRLEDNGDPGIKSSTLERGWTQTVKFSFPKALVFYNAQTGAVAVADSSQPTVLKASGPGTVLAGWTHVVAHQVADGHGWEARILYYNNRNGAAAVGKIDDARGHALLKSYPPGTFPTGWTQVLGNGDQRVLYYNSETRAGAMGETTPAGEHRITASYPSRSFAVPWTHATLLVQNYLLFTSAETGAGEAGYFPGSQP